MVDAKMVLARAVVLQKVEMFKASFGSRSEAGRYAANQRWKGHAKAGGGDDVAVSRRGTGLAFRPKSDTLAEVETQAKGATANTKGASGREVDVAKLAVHSSGKIGDVRQISTDEADFGRRIDSVIDSWAQRGINITTKRHKDEGSNGQRIVPSKMHDDDNQSLRGITDPAERMKAIDGMIEFYGSRKSILYRPPRKKTNPLTDSGFVTRA